MPKGLRFENDYLAGGPANAWVTPNFRLSEYAAADWWFGVGNGRTA